MQGFLLSFAKLPLMDYFELFILIFNVHVLIEGVIKLITAFLLFLFKLTNISLISFQAFIF